MAGEEEHFVSECQQPCHLPRGQPEGSNTEQGLFIKRFHDPGFSSFKESLTGL